MPAAHLVQAGASASNTQSEPIVAGAPTSAFEAKAIGPEYGRNPYRADTMIDGWSRGPFAVRAVSVRGYLHRYNGAPRQDDFAVTAAPERDRLIVAVADGVSAARSSHGRISTGIRGLRAAVRMAIRVAVARERGKAGRGSAHKVIGSAGHGYATYVSRQGIWEVCDARASERTPGSCRRCRRGRQGEGEGSRWRRHR
ncbi:protein phosphatase 2C domain-containing protein [Nocardia sp. NPDC004750]